jgi:hypothetical protein
VDRHRALTLRAQAPGDQSHLCVRRRPILMLDKIRVNPFPNLNSEACYLGPAVNVNAKLSFGSD